MVCINALRYLIFIYIIIVMIVWNGVQEPGGGTQTYGGSRQNGALEVFLM